MRVLLRVAVVGLIGLALAAVPSPVAASGASWSLAADATEAPPLTSAAMAYDSARGRTVLHGLVSTTESETWEWDGSTWVKRVGPANLTQAPVLTNTAMAYDSARGRTVVHGRVNSTQSETWEWDGSTWVKRFGPAVEPVLTNTAMAYDSGRGRTVVHGRVNSTQSETWEYQVTAPAITSVYPNRGAPGNTVLISVSSLNGVTITGVAFNGVATTYSTSGNTVQTKVPGGASTGPITVTTSDGTATSSQPFTVLAVDGFTPDRGPVGTSVTIDGDGLLGVSRVRFGATPASFTLVSDTQIVATVPEGATTGPITVEAYDGSAMSASDFVVQVPTTTVLTSSANPSTFGAAVTFTATVTPVGAEQAGTVAFNAGPEVLAGCAAVSVEATGEARCATSTLAVGEHEIKAAYSGDGEHLPSADYLTQVVVDRTAYTFAGFFAPVDNEPVVNKAKAGRTIPVKWRLTDHDGVPIADPGSFVSLTSAGTTCSPGGSTDAIETYTLSSGLQYLGDGYWQINWGTPRSYAGNCRVMTLNLADGTTHTAKFNFT